MDALGYEPNIIVRDEFGNVRSDGKDNIFAQISGPRSVTAEVSHTVQARLSFPGYIA